MNTVTASGLHWVRDELGAGIERVRALVDDFLMAPDKPLPLQRTLVELHQIRGTLCMVQCEDAAWLAEEMRNAAHDLLADTANAPEQAFEVLLGATVQLADYLDLIAEGERGTGLVFLPLANELRVARGAAVLSESDLFARYCRLLALDQQGADHDVAGDAAAAQEVAQQVAQRVARDTTPAFQAALLSVLRNHDVAGNLARLADTVAEMESVLADGRARRLFVAAGAVLEALIDQAGHADLEAKRLLGQVGQQLKAVADRGGAALAEVPDTLLFGLVFVAGRSASHGPRVTALRADYDLATRLPDADELDRLRQRLRSPNTGLVNRLSDEIKTDLAAAKDGIDAIVRTDGHASVSPEAIRAGAMRIANTLGMLGLQALQRVMHNQVRALDSFAAGEAGDPDAWMGIALALLRVEQSLDRSLFAQVREGGAPASEPNDEPHQDIAAGQAAVHREALVNLARIQSLVGEFLETGDAARLREAAGLFRQVEGALALLGQDEDIGLVGAARDFLASPAMSAAATDSSVAGLFADALAAIEFYLDARRADRPELARLQAHARDRVRALAQPATADTASVEAPDAPAQPSESRETVDLDLRGTFLEEAEEVLETLRREVPPWSANPDDLARLTAIRRAFQTLEGSARMVRADDISEFAGAIENLLNHCLQGTRAVDAAVVAVVSDAVEAIPALIEAFRADRPTPDLASIIARANQAAGASEQRVAQQPEAGTESGLLAVFADEAAGLVAEIEAHLTAWRQAPDNARDPQALSRLCHTLKGSASTAGAEAIGHLAQAIEQAVRHQAEAAAGPDAATMETLHEALDGIHERLECLRRGEPADDPEPLLAKLDAVGSTDPEPASASDSGAHGTGHTSAEESTADNELLAAFLGEAEALMEAIDTACRHWRETPWADTARYELARSLHTLKGSARVADRGAVGDVAHAMETLVERAADADDRARDTLLDTLGQAVTDLYALLDDLRAGMREPDSESLLATLREAIEASGEQASAPSQQSPSDKPAQFDDSAGSVANNEAEPAFASQLDWQPEGQVRRRGLSDTARVAVADLERMLNVAGEVSICHSRIGDNNAEMAAQLEELTALGRRMNDQLRRLDEQIEGSPQAGNGGGPDDLYASESSQTARDAPLKELSLGLEESVADLMSLHGLMGELNAHSRSLVMQQSRATAGLRRDLTRTVMVPFSQQEPRLRRVVSQAANEDGRDVEITFEGSESELDRNVLERLSAPLEHLLRNALVHGIESPGEREAADKPRRAAIGLCVHTQGKEFVIELSDDGRGLDFDAIRATARKRGLLEPDAEMADAEARRFIFQPGFSTAGSVSQAAGRGVGLDVVNNEIQQLGGNLAVASTPGRGVCFTIRVPLTLAVSQVLMVAVGDQRYAVPLGTIEGVTRVPRAELTRLANNQAASVEYGGAQYQVRELGALLGLSTSDPADDNQANRRALLVRAGEVRAALVVDAMSGTRDIVVKPAGPQVASVPGFSAAAIQADGTVVLILDAAALLKDRRLEDVTAAAEPAFARPIARRRTVLVVDDSITVRRLAERFLSNHGFRVIAARDGTDALMYLQAETPDVALLDIEMSQMDGFELASYMRDSERLAATPLIMISSRSGGRHRERAQAIGVDRFLTKPYREQELLAQIQAVLRRPVKTEPATGVADDGVESG